MNKLYELNDGLYHLCRSKTENPVFDCIYRELDGYFFCRVCNFRFPSVLTLPFEVHYTFPFYYCQGSNISAVISVDSFSKTNNKVIEF